jgi:hypothetical protein
VSVAGSTLSNNFDGITTRGNVTATDSTFSDNQTAGFDGVQDATVTGCTFNQNGTAGIDGSRDDTVTNSTFNHNGTAGIDGSRDDTVTNSTFNQNGTAGIDGSRNDTVTNSTFNQNGNAGIDGADTLMVVGSTFSNNNGSSIDGASTLTMTNSTVSGNTYGIDVRDATLSFCTFASNEVYGIDSGDVTIGNSILSAPSGGQNCNPNGATLTSLGHNISNDNSCAAAFTQPGDLNNTDPMIGPLADNGGPTLTDTLLPGSPAVGAAGSNGAPATDQRGVARPQGAAPDIGAFELAQTAAPAVTGFSPSSGPEAGGTLVTLAGTGFTGATAVHFGATEASGVTVVNDTTITATSPPGAGAVDVTVTTPQGTSASSSADQFTFTPSAVTLNATTTTLTSSSPNNTSVFGQPVTFTATVVVVSPGAGTPSGTVTFTDGSTTLGTGTLSGGVATFSTSTLAVGSHSITAMYGGDTNDAGSPSNTVTQTVNQDQTTSELTSSVNLSVSGQPVTFTAKVSVASPGAGTPTGTVTFKDGSTTLGTGTLSGGVATFSTSTLAVGSHSITTTYGGDTNDAGSPSNTVTQVVNALVVDGPRISRVQRFGFHAQPTTLVLQFNESLDPTRAQDVANYAIVADGGPAVAITSAVYDPVTHSVTLTPAQRLNVHRSDELTVAGTGSSGIADASDNLLDGAGTGHTGSDYRSVVTAANLVLGDAVPGGPARLAQLRKAVARIAAHEAVNPVHQLGTSYGAGAPRRSARPAS